MRRVSEPSNTKSGQLEVRTPHQRTPRFLQKYWGYVRSSEVTVTLLIGILAMYAFSAEAVTNEHALQSFLRDYLMDHHIPVDGTTRYSAAQVLLDGKTKMEFVYLSGRWWCGSGGCTALLLEPYQSSFKMLEKFTLVRLPVRVLPHLTNGLHDISMFVRGGGFSSRVAILQYDGLKYPSNPSSAATLQSKEMPGGIDLPLMQEGEVLGH